MALGLAVLPLATACGGGDAEPDARASKVTDAVEAAVVAPAKVEVIADLTGCKVKIRTEADELREGVCRTSKGDYLVTTFPEEKFKEIWLDSASIYGGKYLVGPRWVISGKEKVLEPLRKMVGGTIRDLGRSSGAAPGVPTS
jgi:hypothetical protein